MSWEAWGDDDDGLDGVREAYSKTLLEDGWLDDQQAGALKAALKDDTRDPFTLLFANACALRDQRDALKAELAALRADGGRAKPDEPARGLGAVAGDLTP